MSGKAKSFLIVFGGLAAIILIIVVINLFAGLEGPETQSKKANIEIASRNGFDSEYASKHALEDGQVAMSNMSLIEYLGGDAKTFDSLASFVSHIGDYMSQTFYVELMEESIDVDRVHKAGYEITPLNMLDFGINYWHYNDNHAVVSATKLYLTSYYGIDEDSYYICKAKILTQNTNDTEVTYDYDDSVELTLTIFPNKTSEGTKYTFVPFDYTDPAAGALQFGLAQLKK